MKLEYILMGLTIAGLFLAAVSTRESSLDSDPV